MALLPRLDSSLEEEVERFLRTGGHDLLFGAWPGRDLFARAQAGELALRGALVDTVRARTGHAVAPPELAVLDVVALTRSRVTPMVRGLFPRREQDTVLELLGRSVVFLTPADIASILHATRWPRTAWDLANLYLASCGAELLSDEAPRIVGLSEERTCYVSAEYFRVGDGFADFVVHEAAHIFHNCKRVTVGLPATGRREWLLDVEFRKRETFAYACEAYSRIVALGDGPAGRRRLLAELEEGPMPADETVDAGEYVQILRDAVSARNGWKQILQRCAPPGPDPVRRSSARSGGDAPTTAQRARR